MKPYSHKQTINAIKAARGHHEDSLFMFSFYIKSPDKATHILKMCGRPMHFYKQNAEGCTIKLHKIL